MDELGLLIREAGKALLLPPGGPLVVAFLGLALRRWRRLGNALLVAGLAALYLLATPVVSSFLVLQASAGARPLDKEAARQAQAIVILGGGVRRNVPELGGDSLAALSLERVRYGARLARETGLPVLVTGGSVRGDTRPEAHLLREALEQEFGLKVRWIEERSRNTRENARFSAEMLRPAGVGTIVLVMHPFDVPRAREEFERAALRVIPAPTFVPRVEVTGITDLLPSARALLGAHYAVYELIAQWLPVFRA
jgi:uncharacterized SAM-binding protein YcdF (DUF218 family)